MKIKNEYVKIKQGKNEVELHNLILDKYLSLFASSVLETKYKGLNSCLINCTIQEEITPSMDAMHWDFYLNEQNLYNNSDYKGASKIITKYLYEPNFKEQIQSFIGQKILSIGFAQMVEEPTLPDGSDATFELYAILDVSNYNLYVQDMQEFVVERVDTVTTDMVFSSDTEKFPIHLSPRGNSYFDQQEETGTREVGILNAIGKGYNSMFPTALMPKSNFNITRNENEIDITGLSIQENTGEELYPSNELYPKKKWSEEIQKSEKGSEVIIEGNNKEAFVDIEGKSVQNGTPSPSNPSEIHSVADDVNLWDGTITNRNYVTYINGVVTQTQADTATNIMWKINFFNNSTYVKQTLKTKNDTGIITFEINKDDTFNKISLGLNGSRIDCNITIDLSFLENNKTYTLSFNITNVTQGSISWQDIKIQKGTEATPYSPYNQGTVTIKQRGKNLWTSNLPIIFRDGSSIVQDNNNGGIDMTIASSASFGYVLYDLGLISDFAGKTLTFSISNEPNTLYKWCAFVACNADGSNRQELKNFYKNNQITYTVGNNYSQTHLAVRLYIAEGTGGQTYSINNVQVEENSEKTSYEPYQTPHDYTIQTEPLRSLPNGVKDTIEADGIHRRISEIVFDGSNDENWTPNGTHEGYGIVVSNVGGNHSTSVVSSGFSDKLIISNQDSVYRGDESNIFATLGGNVSKIYIRINNTITSVKLLRQYLQNNPIKIQYQLAEEIIEPFTEEQMEVLGSIQTFDGYNNFTTTDDLQPVIQVTEYENCVYPQKAQMNWIFYQYGIYKFIDTVTGYEYTGRLYREAKNTNKSGNLSLKIKYERGE